MTREEWSKAEPVLSRALLLPEHARKALIDTAFLEDALRRELLEVLDRTSGIVTRSAGASGDAVIAAPPRLITLKPGDAVDSGRFVVIRQIGRGGMGSVYLAHDTMLGTLVALKALPFDERLLAEARRAAVCSDHPHVATVHNVLRTEVGGEPVGLLVMEYVAGTPASRLLDDGPVEIGRALQWGRQVAAAVAHAHDHQVLHCDLKPANIVITLDGRAKVLDFGIARATFDPINPLEPVRGTIPYMAPEQLVAGEFTQAGDIYSLGVTLFEMITGRWPFEGPDAKLRMQILVAPPPALQELVAGVPPQLETILERAMAKNPDRRYRSARAFERALEEVETGVRRTATASVPVPATVSAPLSVWSKVGIAAVSVGGLLIGMIGIGWLTSWIFNTTLERSAFSTEGIGDWLIWGRRASAAPFIWLVMLTVGIVPLIVMCHVIIASSSAARALDGAVRGWLIDLQTRRLGLRNVSVRASYALLISGVMLSAVTWYFSPLIAALLDFVSRAPDDNLALLAADRIPYHNAYRSTFTTVAILMGLLWLSVLRLTQTGQRLHWGMWAGGATVIFATLVLLHFPYRLMNYRTAFESVRWQGGQCYVTGERADAMLLFCPELPRGRRTRVVRADDPEVVHLGLTETNLFNRFATSRSLDTAP